MFFCYLFSNRLKFSLWSKARHEKKFDYSRSLFSNIHRTYRSLCLSLTLLVRLFIFIDRLTRRIILFLETLFRILQIVQGWIDMLRSILSALHLLMARLMILTFKIYQIFYLLSILFEPFSNRTFEKTVRAFSRFLYRYYSSNGACYTLKARVYHLIHMIRIRWPKHRKILHDEDIFYDALNEIN